MNPGTCTGEVEYTVLLVEEYSSAVCWLLARVWAVGYKHQVVEY